jgi:NAD-dependent dihydropyrimidine dehydrogenase PreA subunit
MMMQVNQELCAGCGLCMETCSIGAIHLEDHRAVIDNKLCIRCEACVDACPNGAISVISEPASNMHIQTLPAAETQIIPISTHPILPETAAPAHGLAPLAGAALAFLGKEVAPRLVDVLITALDRRLAQPKTTAITSLSTSPKVLTTMDRGKHRQARHRGGRINSRIQKGRR